MENYRSKKKPAQPFYKSKGYKCSLPDGLFSLFSNATDFHINIKTRNFTLLVKPNSQCAGRL